MDKRICLTKQKKERTTNKELPRLTTGEYLNYIESFFIENPKLDKQIIKNMESEIKKKINAYKLQDVRKKRYNTESFITLEETYDKLLVSKLGCYYCKCNTTIFYTHVRQENQWTLERLDNNYGHSNDNTVIACLDCNLKRCTKSSKDFKFAKQLTIKKI